MIIQHQGSNEIPAGLVDVDLYSADDLLFLKDYEQTRFLNYDDAAFTYGLSVEASTNGRQTSTNTDFNYHIESGSYFQPATTVGAPVITGSGATATATVTVQPVDINGTNAYPGLENQLVFLPDGITQAFVRVKSGATLVLASAVGQTINWSTAVPSGSQLGFYSQISSPGNTPFLDGETFNDTRYLTGTMEVQTSSNEITSYMANSRFQIPAQGTLNGAKPYAIDRLMAEMLPKHEIRKSFHMVWGQGNSYIDKDGNTINTSMGFFELANAFGVNFDIAPQSLVLSDMDNICASMVQRQAGPESLFWCGHRLDNSVDKMIRPTMQNGGVVYSYFKSDSNNTKSPSERAIDYGYMSFRYNNFSFHKKALVEANHPFVTDIGADPLGVKANSGMIIPVGGGMTRQGGQDVYVPSWQVLYKPGRETPDGSMQRVRQYDTLPANFQKERFKRTFFENYALRAFRALKFTSITGVA